MSSIEDRARKALADDGDAQTVPANIEDRWHDADDWNGRPTLQEYLESDAAVQSSDLAPTICTLEDLGDIYVRPARPLGSLTSRSVGAIREANLRAPAIVPPRTRKERGLGRADGSALGLGHVQMIFWDSTRISPSAVLSVSDSLCFA